MRLRRICSLFCICMFFQAAAVLAENPASPEGCSKGCDGVCNSGTVVDECDVCGGDGPGPCGCDESVTDQGCGCGNPAPGPCGCDTTVQKDECGVCGGDGPGPCGCDDSIEDQGCGCNQPPPQECGCGSGGCGEVCQEWGITIQRRTGMESVVLDADIPACVSQALNGWQSNCYFASMGSYPGSCVFLGAVAKVCGFDASQSPYENACYGQYVNDPAPNLFFAVSDDCQTVRELDSQVAAECLAATVKMISPISLMLEGADEEPVLTQFPLNPQEKEAWYFWKASAKSPLLVYDPEHSGKITSATQLFGNWTFGGDRVASLFTGSTAQPWADGFVALSTLDSNNDGKISAAELAPLALWFDENRDGVSQSGEVRSLAAENIVALYYQDKQSDGASRDVSVERGFDRIVNGVVTSGKAVDWYASYSNSRYELLLQNLLKPGAAGQPGTVEAPTAAAAATYDGVWKWQEKQGSESGILVFSELAAKGKLTGLSLMQVPLKGKSQAAAKSKSMLIAVPLFGTAKRTADGYAFEFISDSGQGTRTKTVAALSNGTLTGKSQVMHSDRVSLEYEWSATKQR